MQEAQFEQILLEAVDQAKAFNYHPTRFIAMIRSKGPFQTVKDIVAYSKPSDGFNVLLFNQRVDLTCEAIIVETRWRQHFDDDLLDIAERRLTAHGYPWRRFEGDVSQDPSSPGEHTDIALAVSTDDFFPAEDDQRERALRMTVRRDGQSAFRQALLSAYGSRCIITGLTVEEALEAAHICAYRGQESNHAQNGLLLRADLHNLFDRLLLSIDPEKLTVKISASLQAHDTYRGFDGVQISFGAATVRPSVRALAVHWAAFNG